MCSLFVGFAPLLSRHPERSRKFSVVGVPHGHPESVCLARPFEVSSILMTTHIVHAVRKGLLAVLFCALTAQAQDRGTGVGVIAGEPAGASLKIWTGPVTAVDAAMAWSFDRNTSVQLHSNFLIHDYNVINLSPGRWPVYYGLGARVKFDDERRRGDQTRKNTRAGLRAPLGVAFLFDDYPVDIFVEVVPVFDVTPSTSLTLNAAVGVRYFFP